MGNRVDRTGKFVVSSGKDGMTRQWDASSSTQKPLVSLKLSDVGAIQVAEVDLHNKIAASGNGTSVVEVWRFPTRLVCMPGTIYVNVSASERCKSCAAGKWCPDSSSAEKEPLVYDCPAGTYSLSTTVNLTQRMQCDYLPCPAGTWCPAATVETALQNTT